MRSRDVTLIPASLQAMTLIPIDGKKIKHVAKRIKALRDLPGAVLGAKVLVALRLDTGLAIAFHADPDGEVNDCPLVGGLLSQVRSRTPGPRLYIVDRQFCGTCQLDQFAAEGDHYLARRTTTARFAPDPQRPSQEGLDTRGRRFVESWGDLGTGGKRRSVRQITLERPGEETIILVTELLDAGKYPASDLLEAYLMRWEIEVCQADCISRYTLYQSRGPAHSGHGGFVETGTMEPETLANEPRRTAMRRLSERLGPPPAWMDRGVLSV